MSHKIFEAPPPDPKGFTTGLADAVLPEIAALLDDLIENGNEGAIDLRSLPMTDADREALREKLGTGEVRATLEVAGTSTVEETAIRGVWWIRHEAADGEVANEHIAITLLPDILRTHPADLPQGRARLDELLNPEPEETD
jgi:hydrogenase-1 operon protein HyaF